MAVIEEKTRSKRFFLYVVDIYIIPSLARTCRAGIFSLPAAV